MVNEAGYVVVLTAGEMPILGRVLTEEMEGQVSGLRRGRR